MKSYELNGQVRPDLGKRATAAIRQAESIPAVLYGGDKGGAATHFTVSQRDVRNLVYSPDVYVVDLNIDGKKLKAVVKDIQFHPVSDQILHIDFLNIFEDRPMTVELPVSFEGLASGVRSGGRMTTDMRKLKVRGLLKDMPERLVVDVTSLELGQARQVKDLKFEGLELLNGANAVVCRVRLTRAARGAAAAAAAKK